MNGVEKVLRYTLCTDGGSSQLKTNRRIFVCYLMHNQSVTFTAIGYILATNSLCGFLKCVDICEL